VRHTKPSIWRVVPFRISSCSSSVLEAGLGLESKCINARYLYARKIFGHPEAALLPGAAAIATVRAAAVHVSAEATE
jgi:hypothetical protein